MESLTFLIANIGNISAILVLIVLGGFGKAVMDTLQHHYSTSIFSNFKNAQWWNPKISCNNKYKNGKKADGPKFLGSTTFFVFVTDAWHFYQFVFLSSMNLAILFGINTGFSLQWYHWIIGFILIKTILGSVFELFYKHIFIKK